MILMLDGNRGGGQDVQYRSTCVGRKRQRNAEGANSSGDVLGSAVGFDETRHDRGIETVESNGGGACGLACVEEVTPPAGRISVFLLVMMLL